MKFYAEAGFSHGCSVDHIIFDFDEGRGRAREEMPETILDRYDLTLQLASEFHAESKRLRSFTPLGVIQGWSAQSMRSEERRVGKECVGTCISRCSRYN